MLKSSLASVIGRDTFNFSALPVDWYHSQKLSLEQMSEIERSKNMIYNFSDVFPMTPSPLIL